MKFKITKAEFEALSADAKKEYKATDAEDVYALVIEGVDIGALERAKGHAADEAKAAKKRAHDAETALAEINAQREKAELEAQGKAGNVQALEQSYKEKLAKKDAEHSAALQLMRTGIAKSMVDAAVSGLSGELFTSPKIGAPHVQSRFAVDFESPDGPTLRILDGAGRPSAMTLDDLKQEILTNQEFSPILKATSASGGAPSPSAAAVPALSPIRDQSGKFPPPPTRAETAARAKAIKD